MTVSLVKKSDLQRDSASTSITSRPAAEPESRSRPVGEPESRSRPGGELECRSCPGAELECRSHSGAEPESRSHAVAESCIDPVDESRVHAGVVSQTGEAAVSWTGRTAAVDESAAEYGAGCVAVSFGPRRTTSPRSAR